MNEKKTKTSSANKPQQQEEKNSANPRIKKSQGEPCRTRGLCSRSKSQEEPGGAMKNHGSVQPREQSSEQPSEQPGEQPSEQPSEQPREQPNRQTINKRRSETLRTEGVPQLWKVFPWTSMEQKECT